ncbi:MAG TPA: ABC transporter permease [Planctomycetota bacterium]|nr:ABC transporter permease [Planctomycetota bacterium]
MSPLFGSALTWRYALRSLFRHKRRTALSILGVALGCAVSLMMVSWVYGEAETMKHAAANSGVGHFRIAPAAWDLSRDNKLRLPPDQAPALLKQVRALPQVVVATPHARTGALLAMGTRTTGVELLGVDPDLEQQINRTVRTLATGRYLKPGDSGCCVIGAKVASRLKVGVGDALMVTVSGRDDEMHSVMLNVVGVVKTGSSLLDSVLCHVPLAEIEKLTGYPGIAEISVLLDDVDHLDNTLLQFRPTLPPATAALSWDRLIPELADGVEVDKSFARIIVAVIVLVVFLGIASAQLAAVLERRKEFAVLAAIGMKGRQLVAAMLGEALLLGFLGGSLGLALGTPVVSWLHIHGFDLRVISKDFDLGVSNVLLEPVIHGAMGWWIVPLTFGLALTATVLSSLYPAWYALSTDPANALRAE